MQGLLTGLRKRRRNQKGFTLIEMLVVISILGILAAVVTMSMVGVTNLARTNAQKAEKQTIQVAMDTMANENNLTQGAICGTGSVTASPGTGNMQVFPNTTTPLYPRYLRIQNTTQQTYWCDADGTVHGSATG